MPVAGIIGVTVLGCCFVVFAVVWGRLWRDLGREWAAISNHRKLMRALGKASRHRD